MSTKNGTPTVSGLDDPELAELVAEITDRVNAGERIDVSVYAERCPGREAELRRLLEALCLLDGVSSAPAAPGEAVPEALGDFRIIREVGRGGMGVVYEAEQLSLARRRVALKVLPFAAAMDAKHLQRFKNEACAAASLQHPNIVAVHGVGCERAVHFIVMQFIDGVTLAKVISDVHRPKTEPTPADPTGDYVPGNDSTSTLAAAGLSTEVGHRGPEFYSSATKLIIQAAEALEHAHSMGIVHRDVKPGNLMMDSAGKLWVTDFGLARISADAGMTVSGDLLGTLRYMSPEQAMARHGLVDHRTDVYALGAVLYELLTGRPVVTGDDRQDILRQIAFEEPATPRKSNRAIPADLETIVLKALEKNPTDRYATARELADDLKRWLGEEPIRAKPPNLVRRANKWARRHTGLTYALLASTGVVVIVLAASTAFVWRERDKARTAYQGEAAQRVIADERTRQARDVINEFYQRIAKEWLDDDPQLTEVQREFLEKAMAFSRQLLNEHPTDPQAKLDLASTLHQISYIEYGLGQLSEAERDIREAIDVLSELRASGEDAKLVLLKLGKARNALAVRLFKQHEHSEAEIVAKRSIADAKDYLEAIGDNDPKLQARTLVETGSFENVLAGIQDFNDRLDDAYDTKMRTVTLYRRLAKDQPANADIMYNLGFVCNSLSVTETMRSRPAESARWAQQAIEYSTRALDLEPRKRKHRELVGLVYQASGIGHLSLQKPELAEPAFRSAIQHFDRLIEDFPRQTRYRSMQAYNHAGLAISLKDLKRRDEAEPHYHQAIARMEQVLKESPGSLDDQKRLATFLGNLGLEQYVAKQCARAEKTLRRAEELTRSVAERSPTFHNRMEWVIALGRVASVLKDRGRFEEATAKRRQCLELNRILAEEKPTDVAAQCLLGGALHNLAMSLCDADPAEAIRLTEQALVIQQHAFDALPNDRNIRDFLKNHHEALAEYLANSADLKLRRPAEAVQHAMRATDLLPSDGNAWHALGIAHYRAGDPAAAIAALEKAAKLEDTRHLGTTCQRDYFLALAHRQAGRTDLARMIFERAENNWKTLPKSDPQPEQTLCRVRAEAAQIFDLKPR